MKPNMDNENIKIIGIVKVILCDAKKYPKFEDVKKAIKNGDADIEIYKNLITTAGKTAIARRLRNAGTKSNEGIITYGAVGTESPAVPAVSDTTLGTELERKVVASSSNVNGICTIRVFFTTTEGNGTLTEFGWFGEDASASADSGTLFNRVAISKTKTSAKTLTIEQQFTIS